MLKQVNEADKYKDVPGDITMLTLVGTGPKATRDTVDIEEAVTMATDTEESSPLLPE